MRDPAMYGVLVSRNGVSAYGVSTPVRVGKKITLSPYQIERDTVVDLLRSDYLAMELAPGAVFQMADASGNVTDYDVQDGVKDDPAEPTVQFAATKHK